jgi:hypothetical protein
VDGEELALDAAELLREEEDVVVAPLARLAMLDRDVGAYGFIRVGEVVTDRGGGRREEEVDSGEERYRADDDDSGGDCIEEIEEEAVDEGVVGEVGDAGPGKGEEWRREVVADPGFALRNLSTS